MEEACFDTELGNLILGELVKMVPVILQACHFSV